MTTPSLHKNMRTLLDQYTNYQVSKGYFILFPTTILFKIQFKKKVTGKITFKISNI